MKPSSSTPLRRTYACAKPGCGVSFLARVADRKRGWARHCSKSCAAWMREKQADRRNYSGRASAERARYDEHDIGQACQEITDRGY